MCMCQGPPSVVDFMGRVGLRGFGAFVLQGPPSCRSCGCFLCSCICVCVLQLPNTNPFGILFTQEVGNVPYVVENGCGKFSKSPKEIAKIVGGWFGPKAEELAAMSQNALKLARPDAVFKIVHDMHQLLRQRTFVTHYSSVTP